MEAQGIRAWTTHPFPTPQTSESPSQKPGFSRPQTQGVAWPWVTAEFHHKISVTEARTEGCLPMSSPSQKHQVQGWHGGGEKEGVKDLSLV